MREIVRVIINVLKVVAMLILAFGVLIIFNANRAKSNDQYLQKNLNKLDFFCLKEDPVYTVAFDSKLSWTVKYDIKRAKRKDLNLRYVLGKNEIVIFPKSQTVKVGSEELENFSIFKDSAKNIVVYGNSVSSGFFTEVSVNREEIYSEVLTYNNEVPFAYKQTSMPQKIGEYYLTNTNFSLYIFINKKLVGTKNFPGPIYNSHIINGGYVIAEENNKKNIYKVTIYEGEKHHPEVRLDFVTDITSYSDYGITGIEGNEHTFLLIKKEGKEYVAIPDNFDNYFGMDELGNEKQIKFKLEKAENFRLKTVGKIECLT